MVSMGDSVVVYNCLDIDVTGDWIVPILDHKTGSDELGNMR